MKYLYLILILLFGFASSTDVMADELIINDVIIPPGGTVEVPVDFKAAADGVNVGFTFNLILPEGISTVKDEDGVPEYDQNSSTLKSSPS